MKNFYLGSHIVNWLWDEEMTLFVSHRRLGRYKTLKPARKNWALDSGGFSELSMYGGWQTSQADYVRMVRRYHSEIGKLDFAAIQDWMCEPIMLEKTGLSIRQHQERTVKSYLSLMDEAPDLPWLPVIQGWKLSDYRRCVDLYAKHGVDLDQLPVVGLGSVCRRQATSEALDIIRALSHDGLKLHGFGFKIGGLKEGRKYLASADSMAWSFDARRSPPLPGCKNHKNCANCKHFASRWLTKILRLIETGETK